MPQPLISSTDDALKLQRNYEQKPQVRNQGQRRSALVVLCKADSSYKIRTKKPTPECRTDQQLKQGSKVDLFQGQNVSLVQQQGTVQQGQKLGQQM
ncbi:hypothetical protein HAX54_025939 [Datura stramonium]|uniref:Uncharacterized protein n=1 Tax=Datura stramonium TaxID=4076 RepID=A0ABS8V2F6_DATST|nr:hypothetical protein [Datura stramonium]